MSRAPSGVVVIPGYLTKKRVYVTSTGGTWHPGDVALAFALCIRAHDSADAIRKLARNLVDKVCREHQPNMKLLSRTMDDEKVWNAAMKIVNRVCEMWRIEPETPFLRNVIPEVELVEPPRCHMKPMRLAGYHKHRHWKCQHCKHTKPLEASDGQPVRP